MTEYVNTPILPEKAKELMALDTEDKEIITKRASAMVECSTTLEYDIEEEMMERLTEHSKQTSHENGICCTHFRGPECLGVGGNCAMNCKWEEAAWSRLAAYEDTGLTPQEIASMRNTLGNIGATVYVLLQDGAIYYPETNGWYISEEFIGAISRAGFWLGKPEDGVYVSDDRIGKTVFFTREEAEQALRKEKVKK